MRKLILSMVNLVFFWGLSNNFFLKDKNLIDLLVICVINKTIKRLSIYILYDKKNVTFKMIRRNRI